MKEQEQEQTIDGLTLNDLQEMLQAKSREIAQLNEELAKQERENTKMQNRAIKVYSENDRLKASLRAPPDLQEEIARMEYHLALAKQFTAAGAFPNMTPEQAFTVMKAGAEMGMREMESMNALYIVKGAINPHGKSMPARIKNFGYQIEYLSEAKDHCLVRVYKEENGEVVEDYREKAEADEPILVSMSRFMKVDPKAKMRYHALRKIINFHLPHIYSSVSDMFAGAAQLVDADTPKSIEGKKEQQRKARVQKAITAAQSLPELQLVAKHAEEGELSEKYAQKYRELATEENVSHEEE